MEAAITDKTKLIILNSPSNPTGYVPSQEEVDALGKLCLEKGIVLISDEIYRHFDYDGDFHSPAHVNPNTIVIDGFSKSHAMTGWRLGMVHGPAEIISTMLKVQQYSFVCAPQPAQWAGMEAMDVDIAPYVDTYRTKRDRIVDALSGKYEIVKPGGAFYVFPKAPWGTGSEFVAKAIENNLLIIPGNIFSESDTHFRISYAASDDIIERGIEILLQLA